MMNYVNMKMKLFYLNFALILSLFDCNNKYFLSRSKENIVDSTFENFMVNYKMNKVDTVSFSQADGVIQQRLDFNIEIDMEKRIIDGYVRISYKCQNGSDYMGLDVRDLKINKILDENAKSLKFNIHKNTVNTIGDGLIVRLNGKCKLDSYIDIYYTTDPKSIGIHFSDPSVLHHPEKKYSFLYTHGEAIYSRTFFPCQDTPSLKVTSAARIRIKEPYTVLFSGELLNKKKLENGVNEFSFVLDKPIPTYLISFAAGVVEKKEIPNSRCEVYGEKEALRWIDESFEYCEQYLKFYETYKPFAFKKMVFLIVPDDFPFSGMENPYVTYITEAVLAKDRSYTATIAHEIVHFWSGNLVTNKNWGSFWLNEGITTYLNRKAFRVIHGDDVFFFELYNGQFKLKTALNDLKKNSKLDSSFRSLSPNITDDPYKTFSRIPYEKGAFFLYHLETVVGDSIMHDIMSDYFYEFEFRSLDTEEFIKFFKEKIISYHTEGEKLVKEIKWDDWLHGTEGIPVSLNITSTKVDNFKTTVEVFKKGDRNITDLNNLFLNMTIAEKDRILKEIIEEFNKLPELAKSQIKLFLQDENIFKEHVNVIASRIILQAIIISNLNEKKKFLVDSIENLKFYKVLHLRKVFSLLKEIDSDKKGLYEILSKFEYRFNPLTIARIKEFIEQ